MNCKVKHTGTIRIFNLISVLLIAYPLVSQQTGSLPVITLTAPSYADSLNNSGVITVSAKIVSATPLQAFRIINNSGTVVNETGMTPEKKDDQTYIISSFVPLQKGKNTISVEAKNSGGISYSEARTINSHLEPFITWLSPASDNMNFESGVVNIKIEIKTVYPLQNLNVIVNGLESVRETAGIISRGDNTFDFEKRIQLKTGKNTIYFSANNGKGVTKSLVRILNFGIPPVIILTSPLAKDSINNSGVVTVRAEISSSVPLLTYRIIHNGILVVDENIMSPEKKDSSTYVLGSNIPLRKGLNTVYFEARNALGTAVSEKRTINSHSEPFVTWLVPGSDNVNASSGKMVVKAEIKTIYPLQNLRINVNGSNLSADEKAGITALNNDTYIFEKSIQLKPGKNIINISAGNAKGSVKSVARTVNFGSAPVIAITSPSSRDSLNTSGVGLVRAEIVSFTPLLTFRIINNDETTVNETTMKPEQKDSITYVIGSNVPLKKGINAIYVEAKNALGTANSEKHFIVSQSEPFISWLLPFSPSSDTESGTVNIKAEIKSFLDLQNVRLNLNGIVLPAEEGEITRLNDDTYIFERTLQNALSAKNSLIITASNIRGTTNSEARSINYSSGSKPVITIFSTDSLNNSGLVLFSAEIVSRTKLQVIRIVHNGTILVNESAKIPEQKDSITYVLKSLIPLKAGLNTFYVEAKNNFGTASSGKRNIICQPEPIIKWISPSSASSTDGTGTLKIKAEIVTSFDLLSASVNINGALLADQKDGINRVNNETYVFEKAIPLNKGENNIVLVAGNARGTGYSSKRSISYVPEILSEIKPVTPAIEKSLEIKPATPAGKNPDTLIIKYPENKQVPETNVTETKVPDNEVPSAPVVMPAAPTVTWLSPSRQYTDINLNTAKIRASVKSSGKLESLLVYVNGVASEEINQIPSQGIQGEYALEKSISLQPGENNIYLVATNNTGTTRSETRYLTNPPANPPAVSWAVPAGPNTIVNSEVVVVEACIKSATELKSAKILVNGIQQASEMMFSAPVAGDCNYRLAKSIILKEGDNSIYIIADNFAGSITSDKRVIRFQTGIEDKRLALVIGNADYGNSMVLKNPVNDANLIEGTLKGLGFEVIKRINATKSDMLEAVRDFSKKLTEYNVALFYYAGHGVQVDGENYLIPTGAVLNEQADCKWEAVPVNFIVEEFEKVPENINIVILDACRNNPYKSWVRGGAEGFRALNAVTGTIVSYATSENSTAADGNGSNGTYTEELVKQMVIPQSISSVFINTRKQVMLRTNNTQRPQEWNMLTGDFYFKK